MKQQATEERFHWASAAGLGLTRSGEERQVGLVRDRVEECDQVAVVYDRGENPPEITVEATAQTVQTVRADGVAVAVVARAFGPALRAEDVLLVERCL